MSIIRLRTTDKAEMLAALKPVLQLDADGNILKSNDVYWLLLIPILLAPTGVTLTDEEGNEYPEKIQLDGYHANLVTKDITIIRALKNITITVNKPLLKIAGEK